MNLLFFVHRFWPSIGGVEKYVGELAKALGTMGHEVTVVAGAHVAGLRERERYQGVRLYRFPAYRSPFRCRCWLWRHRHLFDAADVVQVSNTHMLEYLWCMLGPWLERGKLFLTRHGMSSGFPVPERNRARAQRSLDLCSGIAHDGAFIEKWLGVAPDLCPDQGLSPEADELALLPEPAPDSAVYVGRLEPDTGIRIYLDVVRELNRNYRQRFSLDVYGGGSLLADLRRHALDEGLPVRFHGPTPDAQERIADACFALLDGRMAIQEAMARRRVVLAGYVDPLKHDYVCGEPFSSYLTAAGDGAALARQVLYHIEHPQERALCVARAFQYARGLSWKRTAAAYLGLWRDRLATRVGGVELGARLRLAWTMSRETRNGDTRTGLPSLDA